MRKTILTAVASAAAIILPAGAAQASEVITAKCDSVTDGDAQGCLFSGNINGNTDPLNVNSHKNAEAKYNAWANSFNPDLENITLTYLIGTDDDGSEAGELDFADYGSWTGMDTPMGTFTLDGDDLPAGFQLEFFAVKAGPYFMLYEYIGPGTGTGIEINWSTLGIKVGKSPNPPGVSHMAFFGSVVSEVPEPATWAFMIVGFGAIGASLRSARRKTINAVTA